MQLDILRVWFEHNGDFFLTGGGALCGFYGLPRATSDLDLFTVVADAYSRAGDLIHDCCQILGLEFEALVTSRHFRRYRLHRGDEVTLVDLVEDLAPQVFPEKSLVAGKFKIDPAEEIAVNKVCAIVSRSEPRDFYDLYYLTTQGQDPDLALQRANQKDGGVTAETLVMMLREIDWERFQIPGIDVADTARFFVSWLERLTLGFYPGEPPPY
ncbi:MAG: nucleotidyl transferase AbiEii/AbiGii toxin family protein [Candidatus Eremiobacteraeota bacterium]|nr:nucleotidyl transferase AbiEii/AbiGii toxin family protein [Candidatus Eremiobacteraeota bacterium]MCW5869609.1 nucleotidyl transferase AbiEii/AbiGii toxin family protein [Candidatus Eremiobacteraeota bacterium]